MANRNKNKKQFDDLAWMEWRKGGKIQVYELAREGNRIRIRTGTKGKKFNTSTVVKDSAESARIFFERQKREKLRGKFTLIDKDGGTSAANSKSSPGNVKLPVVEGSLPPPQPQQPQEPFQFSFHAKQAQKENEDPSDNVDLPSELDFEVELSDEDVEDEDYSDGEEEDPEEDEDDDGDVEDDDADDDDDEDEDADEDEDEEDADDANLQSPVRSVASSGARRSFSRESGRKRESGTFASPDLSARLRKATSSTASSSSSGRESDDDYEMDYEQMAELMRRAIIKFEKDLSKGKVKFQWKKLKRWIRYDENGVEHQDKNARYHIVPLLRRIAGSCHELVVIRIRSGETDEIVTRLLKVARDPDEDNAHHFITERRVACRLSKIARVINRCYNTRTDVCVWPVETICFEWKGQSDKWATVQAPFLPRKQTNYCFVKIEPNSGAPCVNDAVVGRYQHAFAAVSRGLDLVRDWQGYGVDAVCFAEECKKYCPEAMDQLRPRRNGPDPSTQVLVVIDPVLTTATAHYETNNPTDFGVKAIDEWQATHDCQRSRCSYFHLEEEIRFGLGDPDQTFLSSSAPEYLVRAFEGIRKELNIWCGDDDFDPSAYF